MVEALAGTAFGQGKWRLALLVLVGFEVYLRTGELLSLRAQDFIFGPAADSFVIWLGVTKGGERRGVKEQVVVRQPWLCVFAKLVCQDLEPGDPIFPERPAAFRQIFAAMLAQLGLQDFHFRPYSLRRGGCTAAFRAGASYDAIAEVSRHANIRTLRIYITDALMEQQSYLLNPELQRLLKNQAALLEPLRG